MPPFWQAVGNPIRDPQSPHPSPGVQLRGGNRQIRTTVPPLDRGVTPVIAGVGDGLLGRVQRRDVPDLQRVVKAAAHCASTPAPVVAAPLAPDGPTLRLRSPDLTPPPAAYLMELRSTRKPRLKFRYTGVNLWRNAERQNLA